MNTLKLYESDAHQTEFEATIIDAVTAGGRTGLILDRTLFYPTGGGQPHDTGTLGGIPVVDVIEQDEAVVHITEGAVGGRRVTGTVDWKRRFDHMQQHTGQHVLSQAMLRVLGADTIGFHLGQTASTIDLTIAGLAWNRIRDVEKEANGMVFGNAAVRVHEASRETLSRFPLRKAPAAQGVIRVVEIDGYDWSACCGTHVRSTGEIGLIKVVGFEKYKAGSRVTFLCGFRALSAFQQKTEIIETVSRRLTVGEADLVAGIDRLAVQQKAQQKIIRDREDRVLTYEAADKVARAETIGDGFFVHDLFVDRDVKSIRALCMKITANPQTVCLLGVSGDRATVILGQAEDGPMDLKTLTEIASEELEGRGGGNARLVQVTGEDPTKLDATLEKLTDHICRKRKVSRHLGNLKEKGQ